MSTDHEGERYEVAALAGFRALADHNIGAWRAMSKVLDLGERCPHYLHTRKAGAP